MLVPAKCFLSNEMQNLWRRIAVILSESRLYFGNDLQMVTSTPSGTPVGS